MRNLRVIKILEENVEILQRILAVKRSIERRLSPPSLSWLRLGRADRGRLTIDRQSWLKIKKVLH